MKDGILRPTGEDMDEIKDSQKAAARRIEEYFAEAVKDRQKKKIESKKVDKTKQKKVDKSTVPKNQPQPKGGKGAAAGKGKGK